MELDNQGRGLKEGLYPRHDGMPRERECVWLVQGCLIGKENTH